MKLYCFRDSDGSEFDRCLCEAHGKEAHDYVQSVVEDGYELISVNPALRGEGCFVCELLDEATAAEIQANTQ